MPKLSYDWILHSLMQTSMLTYHFKEFLSFYSYFWFFLLSRFSMINYLVAKTKRVCSAPLTLNFFGFGAQLNNKSWISQYLEINSLMLNPWSKQLNVNLASCFCHSEIKAIARIILLIISSYVILRLSPSWYLSTWIPLSWFGLLSAFFQYRRPISYNFPLYRTLMICMNLNLLYFLYLHSFILLSSY